MKEERQLSLREIEQLPWAKVSPTKVGGDTLKLFKEEKLHPGDFIFSGEKGPDLRCTEVLLGVSSEGVLYVRGVVSNIPGFFPRNQEVKILCPHSGSNG